MKIVYVADDGKMFDNEYECGFYEWVINHPHIHNVSIFDENDNKLEYVLTEDTYNKAMKIVIPNSETLKDFQDFADYTGYCAYDAIDQVGEWRFDECKEGFFKV